MGFYSTKTSEEKRVKQLTGDIHLSEEFKEEIKNRDIPIYQGYNIQKRLRFEVEQGQLKGDEVDSRLMELLEENSKNNVYCINRYFSSCYDNIKFFKCSDNS